ncbi:MAG: hypothetical protein AB8D52_03270 [Gammaproteobacteria bacterium]
MSKKNSIKPVVGMLGTAFAVSLAFSPITNAESNVGSDVESNPFSLIELSSGYEVAEGKCGEGKCGEKKAEGKCGEGKCGEKKCDHKKAEGKCGEGKCGEAKKAEGKCGEGKCGAGE